MEEWLVFLLSGIAAAIVLVGLRFLRTEWISAVAMSVLTCAIGILIFSEFHVSQCQYDKTAWDTVRGVLLLVISVYLIVWMVIKVLQDNKHHRFCDRCRQRVDLQPPVEYPIKVADDTLADAEESRPLNQA